MNKYEIMYILKANLDEEARKNTIAKLHGILTDHGAEVTKVEEWGLRDFAYPVKDEVKGYYVVIKVSANPDAKAEFERLAKLDNNVLRHIVVVDQD
jgi:small subunit ribosomal protein S6